MTAFNSFIDSVNVELSTRRPDDPLRAEYDRAVSSLLSMFDRLDHNDEIMSQVVDALIEDFEKQQDKITEHLLNKEFSGARVCVHTLQSGLRQAITPTKLETIQLLDAATVKKDWNTAFRQWNTLHCRLFPMISIMRRFQSFFRGQDSR